MNFEYLYYLLDQLKLNEMSVKELQELKTWIENNDNIKPNVKECDIWVLNEELENR